MNALLARICGLLKSPRPEQQMAAAIVLGELAPKDQATIRSLSAALAGASRTLRLAILDTLAQAGSPLAVPDLLPLLESTDDEVREKATHALVRIGPAAIKPIARHILDAPPAARRALIGVLSRVRSADSVQALMSLLPSGHPDAAREAAQALISVSHGMSRSEQTRLRGSVEKLLRTPPDKAASGSLSAALMILGSIGQPGASAGLLRLIGTKYPETVRRDALLAISSVLKGGVMPPRILASILPIIQDGPSPALRSAALEVLGAVELPASALVSVLALIENADPAVRRFAARKLGSKGLAGVKAARRLTPLLADTDPSLREAASEALARIPEASNLLIEDLLDCDDVHRAWALAHILRQHVARLRRPAVRGVFDRAVRALCADDRLWEPLLFVVRHHDPRLMYDWLMEEAARLKKARRYGEAESCLKPLTRGDHFDSEARYALALAGIRAARSRGAGSSAGGASALDLFRQLVRDPSFPLVDRLKKERAHLETEDLYHLGFHLSEGTPAEKEVGGELLKIVAARAGTSKLGRSARNKLRAEGLAV